MSDFTPIVLRQLQEAKQLKDSGIFDADEFKQRKVNLLAAFEERHPTALQLPVGAVRCGGGSARLRAKKPKKRQSLKRHLAEKVTAATGMQHCETQVRQRQSSHTDRRSQETLAAGRAAPRRHSAPARALLHVCPMCAAAVARLEILLVGARLTALEKKRKGLKSPGRVYNYQRLKDGLVREAFDPFGNAHVCACCLGSAFAVGHDFIADAHRKAIESRAAPLVEATAEDFANDATLESRVVVPVDFHGTCKQYIASLKAGDKANVTLASSSHGLVGLPSNRGKPLDLARRIFFKFVENNRRPTGRTKHATDHRFHGAEHYVDAQWTQFLLRSEAARVSKNKPDAEVFTVAARAFIAREIARLQSSAIPDDRASAKGAVVPSHISIARWFRAHFAPRSEFGHTTLHPAKTDACSECCKFDADNKSYVIISDCNELPYKASKLIV